MPLPSKPSQRKTGMEAAESCSAFRAATPVICFGWMNARGTHPALQVIAPNYVVGTSLIVLMICAAIWYGSASELGRRSSR